MISNWPCRGWGPRYQAIDRGKHVSHGLRSCLETPWSVYKKSMQETEHAKKKVDSKIRLVDYNSTM